MISVEEVTELDRGVFDTLFAHSLPYIDAGTFHWSVLGNPTTAEEKADALWGHFQKFMATGRCKALVWREDDEPLSMAVGAIDTGDEDYIKWVVILYGPDANGSRAYMHQRSFIEMNRQQLRDVWGLKGLRASCVNGSSVMQTHLNKTEGADYFDITHEVHEENNGIQLATFTYTYK